MTPLPLYLFTAHYDPGPMRANRVVAIVALTLPAAAEAAEALRQPHEMLVTLQPFQGDLAVHNDVAAVLGASGLGSVRPPTRRKKALRVDEPVVEPEG